VARFYLAEGGETLKAQSSKVARFSVWWRGRRLVHEEHIPLRNAPQTCTLFQNAATFNIRRDLCWCSLEFGLCARSVARTYTHTHTHIHTHTHTCTHTHVQVVLKTASALYECVRPSTSYRKLFSQLEEQLDICHQVCVGGRGGGG